jgi:CHAT domain-containing protein
VGLIANINVPLLAQQVEGTSEAITQDSNAQVLLRQGIERYEAERFSEAVEVWQRASRAFALQRDNLSQALVLSNLSLAYQHQGQWEEAERAITTSLNLLQNPEDTANTQAYSEILAKALNTQGNLQWAKGQLEEALNTWEAATDTYAKAGNEMGIVGSLINQTKVLQALGFSSQAEVKLQQINQILERQPDPRLKATGLRNLGNALRRVGRLEESRQVLAKSLKLVEQLPLPKVRSATLLELGNTERALGNQAIAIGKVEEAGEHTQAAIRFYQEAAIASDSTGQLQPQLNQLSLLIETGQRSDATRVLSEIQESLASLPPSRTAIHARLNFARSLTCLKQDIDTVRFSCISNERREQLGEQPQKQNLPRETPSWQQIAQLLSTTIQQAQSLKDLRSESYAFGQLGGLYELTGQWSEAQNLTQQALLLVETLQAPDIRYRWEWQLGRLLEKQGDIKGAIAYYTAAVETLKSVRRDLLTINSDVQFSFRDNVEPVYRELVDLLLRTDGTAEPSQENLKRAIEDIDALQLAELENFLGCNLAQTVQLNQDIDKVDQKAAFIYPIILEERLEVIFKLPGQPLRHYATSVNKTAVEKTLRELQAALVKRNAGRVIEKSKAVYRWLIKPLEEHLEKSSEIETLVFVLDGYLRNIPIAALYDEQANEYLIEKKYALVLLPSSQVFDLRALPGRLQVLGAGISERLVVENRRFDALNTTEELDKIENVVSSKILLNSQFTQPNLQQAIKSGNFSVVHLATHGNFSSDSENTFILVYGELLRANNLNNLFRSANKQTASPLDLLVLSACKTAEGDNRATLGMAGLAVRSGARSTLATLWQVSDESTVKLMEQFYSELTKPGVSKAQALHHAQQALLVELKYQNPYYWAPYVLVGNWR